MHHDRAHYWMAYKLPLRDDLSSLADTLQLDIVSCRDDELPRHVCLQQCDRHCARYRDLITPVLLFEATADHNSAEDWGH